MPRTDPQLEPRIARSPDRRDSTSRTSVRTAIWNAATALAIIAVLFITFYGLSAQRDPSGSENTVATAPAAPQTTGQGGGQTPPETTGQGGAPNSPASGGQR